MVSDALPDLPVDIFAFHPFDSDAALSGTTVSDRELASIPVHFAHHPRAPRTGEIGPAVATAAVTLFSWTGGEIY